MSVNQTTAMDFTFKKLWKQVSIKVLIIAVIFLASLFFFAFIAHEAVFENEDIFDSAVHSFFMTHTSPVLIQSMEDFTFLGSSTFLLSAYAVIIGFLLMNKNKRKALDISIVATSSFLLMRGLKLVFHRHRPDLPIIKGITTYSFPSGHTLSSFIFFSILTYLIWNTRMHAAFKVLLSIIMLLLSLMVGVSRIVLNVHYATDVIAGFCLGVMWVILSFWVIRSINRKQPA